MDLNTKNIELLEIFILLVPSKIQGVFPNKLTEHT